VIEYHGDQHCRDNTTRCPRRYHLHLDSIGNAMRHSSHLCSWNPSESRQGLKRTLVLSGNYPKSDLDLGLLSLRKN
jgi:hypothetical protein